MASLTPTGASEPDADIPVDRYGDPLFGTTRLPQCGWLAPDARFVPCIPWEHTEKAQDICRALGIDIPDPIEGASGTLFKAGWVKIARASRADHRRIGGRFRFEHPTSACSGLTARRASLTEAQAQVEAAWMEMDAVDLDSETP